MKRYFMVSYDCDVCFSANIIWSDCEQAEQAARHTAENHSMRFNYRIAVFKEVDETTMEENRAKGMPIIKADDFTPDPTPGNHSDDEQPETTLENHSENNNKKGDKTMKKFEFTITSLTCYNAAKDAAKTFPARYELQDAADMKRGQVMPIVYIFATVDEKTVKIAVPYDDEFYAAAYEVACAAAEQPADDPAPVMEDETPETTPGNHSAPEEVPAPEEQPADDPADAGRPETIPEGYTATITKENHIIMVEKVIDLTPTEDAAPETPENHSDAEQPAPVQAAAAPEEQPADDPAPDPKQAHGPIPEKTFIGTTIKGARYEIIFDADAQRTRVIIPEQYRAALKSIVENAGFYYAPRLDSWNKKLTFRAWRAAVALAAALDKAA